MMLINVQAAGLAAEIANHFHQICLEHVRFCWRYIATQHPCPTADQGDELSAVTVPSTPEEVRQCFGSSIFNRFPDGPNIGDDEGRFRSVRVIHQALREIADGLDATRSASLRSLVTESELAIETTFWAKEIYAEDAFNVLVLWRQKWLTMSRHLVAGNPDFKDNFIPSESAVQEVDVSSPFNIVLSAFSQIKMTKLTGDQKMKLLFDEYRDEAMQLLQTEWAQILQVSTRSIRGYKTWEKIQDLIRQHKTDFARLED